MNFQRTLLYLGVLLSLIGTAGATSGKIPTPPQMQEMTDLNAGLKNVASALGVLVITYAGVKWVMSEGPQDRDEAKKTIIYVVVGLVVVSMSQDLTNALYNPVTGCLVQ
ncbi:MAG: hypothetical protein FJY77_01680 [Candidatus Altiarchaeales archaeon]|nr:hypothetical protein [Candidatus Altiarchaeales archaeon]